MEMKFNLRQLLIGSCMILLIVFSGCSNKSNSSITKESSSSVPVKEALQIKVGDIITSPNVCTCTLSSVLVFNNIKDSKNSTGESKPGLKKLAYILNVKNLQSVDLQPKDKIHINISYNNKYKYSDTLFFAPTKENTIKPLEVSKIYAYVEVPDEVVNNLNNLQCNIIIVDKTYQFIGSIENADNYIQTMNKNIDLISDTALKIADIMKKGADDMQNTYITALENYGDGKDYSKEGEKVTADMVQDIAAQLKVIKNAQNTIKNTKAPLIYEEGQEKYIDAAQNYYDAYQLYVTSKGSPNKETETKIKDGLQKYGDLSGEAFKTLTFVD